MHAVHVAWTKHLFSNAAFLGEHQTSDISLFQPSLNLRNRKSYEKLKTIQSWQN